MKARFAGAVGRRFVRNMGCILRSRRTVRLCSVVRASYRLCVSAFSLQFSAMFCGVVGPCEDAQ